MMERAPARDNKLSPEVLDRQFRKGESRWPRLANGYRFVIDHKSQSGSIPRDRFTLYVSERCLPLSPPDTSFRTHDMLHVPNYQNMVDHPIFADVIQSAAAIGFAGGYAGQHKFAAAFDRLGDNMTEIEIEATRNGNMPKAAEQARTGRNNVDILIDMSIIEVTKEDRERIKTHLGLYNYIGYEEAEEDFG